jgi:O-antigen/teichoic acid export membrane protein
LKSTYQNSIRSRPVYWGIAAKLAAETAGRFCQLGFIVLVARSVGVENFGFYSLAVFCGFLAGQLADGGLHLLTNREEVSAEGSFAPLGFHGKLWSTGLLLPGLGLVALLYSSNIAQLLVFWAIAYSFVIYSLGEFGFSLLRARGQLAQEALLVMSNRILLLSLGLMSSALLRWGLVGFALAHLLSSSFTALLALRKVEAAKFFRRTRAAQVWTIWKKAFPLGLGLLLSLLAFRLDLPLLAQFRPNSEVGHYSAAYRIFEPVLMLPAVLMAGLFPALVRTAHASSDFIRLGRRLITGLTGLGVTVALGLAVLSSWLIGWLYGGEYKESAGLLVILAGAIPFMYANYGLTHVLIALRRERANTFFFGVALAVNLGLNLALIPLCGAAGAALTTILTELILSGLCLVSLSRKPRPVLQPQTSEV